MNHDHVVYEYMGAECSKLRQPMRAILALSRAQLLLIVVTRSRDLSRECHVTKHKTPARSNFPMSSFENSGTIQFSSSRSTSRGLCPKSFEKRAHPNVLSCIWPPLFYCHYCRPRSVNTYRRARAWPLGRVRRASKGILQTM